MPEVHAILSASSSKRWLNCTPSARLEQNFPNESSVYAEEGTAAHALGEYKLRKYLHERVKRPTSEYEDEEMEANTDIYAEFIISTVERIKETCPHPLVMVEERLDYSYLVPSGFGTGDCVIIADGTLYVMDYKNGKPHVCPVSGRRFSIAKQSHPRRKSRQWGNVRGVWRSKGRARH